jgi:hypothetical protein
VKNVAIVVYYLAIVMLILFVGVVIYRLLFGTPCTLVGNYCVGDGWSIAGLAATILGVAATVLGILGAFALAAWWTDLDSKVRAQVDINMKHREKALIKQNAEILAKLEAKLNAQLEEELITSTETMLNGLKVSKQLMDAEIKTLRSEYDDINKIADNTRKLAVDIATLGDQRTDEWVLSHAANQYRIVDIAVNMVEKYLIYIDIYLVGGESDKELFLLFLNKSGVPYTELQQLWDRILFWQNEVNKFSNEHPDIVKQVNDKIEDCKKRIDEAEQKAAHEV